jgi:hypothetical protein
VLVQGLLGRTRDQLFACGRILGRSLMRCLESWCLDRCLDRGHLDRGRLEHLVLDHHGLQRGLGNSLENLRFDDGLGGLDRPGNRGRLGDVRRRP